MSAGLSEPGRPPRLAEWLLSALLPAEDREAVLGDLAEEHAGRLAEGERVRSAGRWYWRQTLASALPALVLRWRRRSDRRAAGARNRTWREPMVQTLLQDARHTLRVTARYPTFAAMVVLTLGLGIAANTVVFSVVDGVVLNPFPYPAPERLVGVGPEFPRLGQELSFLEVLSPAEFRDISEQSRTLERVVAWDMGNRQVTVGDATENLFTAFWWGDAFRTLEMRPALGRGFLPEEVERGERVAILSHRVWQTRFGADPGLLGGTILVNGQPYTLVGVMPPRMLILGTDLWVPMYGRPEEFPREGRQFQVLARLARGATLERANLELETLARRVEREHGSAHREYEGWRLQAMTWEDINVRMLRPAALILTGAVGFVLLLVCANVATLLLARATGRRREMAVRTALGAGWGRLLRQLLTESVLLSTMGGLVGVGLAWLGVRALVATISTLTVPVPGEVTLNGRVLVFTALVSVAAGILFGIVPAVQGVRLAVHEELKAEGAGTTGGARRLRLQRVFVGVEVALAVVLLVAGGLLVHSFLELQAVEPGFNRKNVLTMRLTLARERYDEDRIDPFFRELVRHAETIPGVTAAATATQFPPGVFLQREFQIEGRQPAAGEVLPTAFATIASPGYFGTLEIPVHRGRLFGEADRAGGPVVVVINEAAARRYFPGEDPLGKRLRLGGADSEGPWMEIVGVVGSTRNRGLDAEPEPELFASSRQLGMLDNQHFLLLRTRIDPRSVLPAVRREVRALDPLQPVYRVQTVEDAYATLDAPRRISTVLLSLFAGFALVLAAMGIYGVVSYSVGQRRREIGVRLALAAEATRLRWLIVRQALLPVAVGAAAGLAGALALGGVMSSLLYEVSGTDPVTLLAVTLLLGAIALVASYLPARRASRLDPLLALRPD